MKKKLQKLICFFILILIFFLTFLIFKNKKKIFIKNIYENNSLLNDCLKEKTEFFYDENIDLKEQSWVNIADNSSKSVGQLISFMGLFNWKEPYKTPDQVLSSSTAFFIDENGYMLTNAHCVNQQKVMYLQLPFFGKNRFCVSLVAICPDKDLALIRLTEDSYEKIKKKLGKIKYLKFGKSDNVKRADEIITLGYPLGQEWLKVTAGGVSGIQTLENKQYIQIDAPINPGNSGGPALNNKGLVIGMNTAVINKEGIQNVGYIIPSKDIEIFLMQTNYLRKLTFKEVNDLDRPVLINMPIAGINYHGAPEALINYLGNPIPGGVYISHVAEKCLFYEAGIKEGDMIYKINEHDVDRFGEIEVPWSDDKISFAAFLGQLKVDSDLTIKIYRQGKEKILKTKWNLITNLPVRFMYPYYEDIPYLVIGGIVLMPLSFNHIQIFGCQNNDLLKFLKIKNQLDPAVIVSHVLPNSVGERSRFVSPGMIIEKVNNKTVKTISDIENFLLESLKTEYVTINFKNGEFFVARLEDIIKDEVKLSYNYFYTISPIITKLMNEYKKNQHLKN
jgi:S1-C subfamily serine protease